MSNKYLDNNGLDRLWSHIKSRLDKKANKTDIPTSSGGGGTSIDVTAEVGQTIIVKEVDANGKPTKWESADYQPRTHYIETIFPETEGVFNEETGVFVHGETALTPTSSNSYTVAYNGVEYTCSPIVGDATWYMGNLSLIDESIPNTGEPFIIGCEGGTLIAMPLDGAESVRLAIKEVKPIPQQYLTNAFPYYIEVEGTFVDESSLVCNDTVANVEQQFNSGRTLVLKASGTAGNNQIDMFFTFSHRQKNLATGQIAYGFYYFLPLLSNPTNAYQNVLLLSQEDGTFKVTTQLTDL